MYWVSWNKILASEKVGWLGVGSLFAFDRALMFRWRWRFFHHPTLLWVRVVKAIYGIDGGLSSLSSRGAPSGLWNNLISMISNLKNKEIDLISLCRIRVRDGASMSFWHDIWLDDVSLVVAFHKIYDLDVHKVASVRDRFLLGWDSNILYRPMRGGIEQT